MTSTETTEPKALKIVHFPDPRLSVKCEPVDDVNSEDVQTLISQMLETVTRQGAEGLAANQVGRHLNIFIIKDYYVYNEMYDSSGKPAEPSTKYLVFINPKLTHIGTQFMSREGCLSFPGIEAHVPRCDEVEVTALDRDGREVTVRLVGISAVAAQHEYDHLLGLTFLDRVGKTEGRMLRAKMEKQNRRVKTMLRNLEKQVKLHGNTLR